MLSNIGLYSYGAALVAYALLSLLVATDRNRHNMGPALLWATTLTALWAGIIAAGTLQDTPPRQLMNLAELLRDASWCYLLLKLIDQRLGDGDHRLASGRWVPVFGAVFFLLVVILFAPPVLSKWLAVSETFAHDSALGTWLALSIVGMLLLEQIYRNSVQSERWSIKYLCLGIGVMFAYDFFMYAEGLLFQQLDSTLWQARGVVNLLAAGLIAIAVVRISKADGNRQLIISRHVAFHTITLLASGLYLIMMALAGYFIRYLGGSWGGVLQVTFLCAAGLLFIALLFSGQIRARTRVWLSKNFFSYKYDYRIEWLQFTQSLSAGDGGIPERIIRAMGHLTKSPAGLLWSKTDSGLFELSASWQMAEPLHKNELHKLPQWLQRTEWIIDMQEWRLSPDIYNDLEMPELFNQLNRPWLIIPLMTAETLQGIVLLRESDLQPEINWEDRDLLKVAGRQAASHLAQYQANKALVESRQFEAFNRLSAYVIHDLKNILAQQALIVSNASKHRDNPAFIDDVIGTVENSVTRMTRLMEQMRSGVRGGEKREVALRPLLEDVLETRKAQQPQPVLNAAEGELMVHCDREQLATVFNHIIQNAQEATERDGSIKIRLSHDSDQGAVVEIEDTGIGMDANFLRDRLFNPFDSTKGLTGMGIGAFESREFIRSLGGDISVSSEPGVGSLFAVSLPCTTRPTTENYNGDISGD